MTTLPSPAFLTGLQLRYEQKAFWRNPAAAFFSFAFPIVLFVFFSSLFHSSKESVLAGVKGINYYTPAIMAYGMMAACYTTLAITISFRREQGLLKRVRGTPLPAGAYLGGLIANSVIVGLLLAAIIVSLGLAYGATAPHAWLGLIVTTIVGGAVFCVLGLATTAVIPNADAAPAIVNFITFSLIIISGGFFPISSGSVLTTIARIFPLRWFIEASFNAFDPRTTAGSFPWKDVGIMTAWGVLGIGVTLRLFRWEPRRS